jgi:hypothetical protein
MYNLILKGDYNSKRMHEINMDMPQEGEKYHFDGGGPGD